MNRKAHEPLKISAFWGRYTVTHSSDSEKPSSTCMLHARPNEQKGYDGKTLGEPNAVGHGDKVTLNRRTPLNTQTAIKDRSDCDCDCDCDCDPEFPEIRARAGFIAYRRALSGEGSYIAGFSLR